MVFYRCKPDFNSKVVNSKKTQNYYTQSSHMVSMMVWQRQAGTEQLVEKGRTLQQSSGTRSSVEQKTTSSYSESCTYS